MRIGLSLVLIAAGAILTWGVTATVSGVNIHVIGVILMAVGALGVVLSLIFLSSVRSRGSSVRRDVITDPAGSGPFATRHVAGLASSRAGGVRARARTPLAKIPL